MFNRRFAFVPLLVATLLLTGCWGWTNALTKSFDIVKKKLVTTEQRVTTLQKQYQTFKTSAEYRDFFAFYAEKENWVSHLTRAEQKLNDAKNFKKQLDKLQNDNRRGDESKVKLLIQRMHVALREATESANIPFTRKQHLAKVCETAPALVATARQQVNEANRIFTELEAFILKTKTDHTDRVEDIDKRFSIAQRYHRELTEALNLAQVEFDKTQEMGESLEKGVDEASILMPDYAILGDNVSKIANLLTNLNNYNTDLRKKLAELNRSYEKILVDMRVDYYIVLKRYSWNEGSDWDNSPDHTYAPVKVDQDVYAYFSDNEAVLFQITSGWGGRNHTIRTNASMWNKLGINPEQAWPSSDNAGEISVENAYEKYFHKYFIIEDGKKRETDWVEVKADFFEEHLGDPEDDNNGSLGMAIVSKPLGKYEEEALKTVTPPGFSKVGDTRYGKWVTNEKTGERQWSWLEYYAVYHLMFGGSSHHYYHYNDWNSWDRRSSYYGPRSDPTRYGTYGRTTSSRFASRRFVRSGSLGRHTASVRGASRSSRGRGPGGRGK